jgi:HAD superfamily hydrolase (TIGR01458 family)
MDKGFIIDLEGTLISSGTPLEGSIDFINHLNKNNIKHYIITNTVSKSIDDWEKILKEIGFDINKDKIITPIIVLNDFINIKNIKTYYFIGPDRIKNLVQKTMDYDIPEYVVFCDFEYIDINYELFNKIYHYIKNGSKMITTSYSNYYISNNQYKMDTGIFVKMYETLANEKSIILGKPSQIIYEMVLRKMGIEKNNIIAIGDDGLTDIIGGKEMGFETILVKTGKYKNGDEEIHKPNKIINNIKEIIV